MKLTLRERTPETPTCENFFWEPETPIDFTPGQYLRWLLPQENPDDRGTSRFFSIASSPTEELIRLTTKFSPKSSTFKQSLQLLKLGDSIDTAGPMGKFVLDANPGDEVVLVAGGIGITPYRSMLKYMHDSRSFIPVHLIYACRSPEEAAFKPFLEELKSQHHDLTITYDFGSVLTGQTIKRLSGDGPAKTIYLSGPQPMIEALKSQLLELGHQESHIKTDYFPGYDAI